MALNRWACWLVVRLSPNLSLCRKLCPFRPRNFSAQFAFCNPSFLWCEPVLGPANLTQTAWTVDSPLDFRFPLSRARIANSTSSPGEFPLAFDQDLFFEICQQHKQTIIGFLTRKQVGEPEEVWNDILMIAFHRKDGLQQPDKLPALLMGIAKNQGLKRYRDEHRMKRDSKLTVPLDPDAKFFHSQNPEDQLLLNTCIECIDSEMNNMPNNDRRIFFLYLTNTEIAEISTRLQIPSGTVKSKIHYSKNKLREHCKEHCPDSML